MMLRLFSSLKAYFLLISICIIINYYQVAASDVDVELVKPAESVGNTASSQPNPKIFSQEIVPARGWVVDEDGNLTLVGYDPTLSGLQRPGNQTLACN